MYNTLSNYPISNSYTGYKGSISNINGFDNDDRLIGGPFIAPFLLGGLAGAAISPLFYRPYYYPPYYFPPQSRFFW